jgi:copper transport protein
VDAITTTWYGRLVVGKVLGLAVIIGLGYFARRIVLRRDWAVTGGPLRRMRATLLTEVCVGALVLAMSGVLISQAPGKVALAAERSRPRSATVAVTGSARATVSITPGVHGSVSIDIVLSGSITPSAISASASLPSKSLGPIALALQSAGPTTYTASGVILPSAGAWQITVTVQTSQFDSTTAVATVRLD